MFRLIYPYLLLIVFAIILTACGSSDTGEIVSDDISGTVMHGKSLYEQTVIGTNSAPGCTTCHSLEAGVTLVGPSHAGLASRATEIIKSADYTGNAKTVEEYLRESIVNPNIYVEEGFPPSVMYPNYEKELSAQEIDDIVAFMLTLK